MSKDPLELGGLDGEVLAEAVSNRPGRQKKESDASKLRAETAAKKEERLTKPSAASSSSAPPPPPPEPVVDKSELIDKIGAYRERFPELKSRNKIGAKSSVEEMEDELHYIEKQLGGRDMSMGMTVLTAVMTGIEHFNPLGLNLTGLSQVTRDNGGEFEPIMDELMIKYGVGMSLGPEARLALAVGSMIYTVHSANSGDPRIAEAMARMNQKVKVPTPDDL